VKTKLTIALVALFLMLAGSVAGSYVLSLMVARQSTNRLCNAFELFIHQPAPPVNTPLKIRQEAQYHQLKVFERHLGC
jgi:hypothetical protein